MVHITWLKKIMQLNDENACQNNTYQVSHTRPTTLKFSQLPLAPNGEGIIRESFTAAIIPGTTSGRYLVDISSPQESTFKHVEDYISTLWLQGTFYNFYPFEIQFFSIVI